jgi:hypothetical protein
MTDEYSIRSHTIPVETVATISQFPPYHLIVTVEFYFNFGVNESRIMPSKYLKYCCLDLPSILKCFSLKMPLCQLSIRNARYDSISGDACCVHFRLRNHKNTR